MNYHRSSNSFNYSSNLRGFNLGDEPIAEESSPSSFQDATNFSRVQSQQLNNNAYWHPKPLICKESSASPVNDLISDMQRTVSLNNKPIEVGLSLQANRTRSTYEEAQYRKAPTQPKLH